MEGKEFEAILIDNRRPARRVPEIYHTQIGYEATFEGINELFRVTPEILERFPLVTVRGGDGTTGYVLSKFGEIHRASGRIPVVLHERGGTANTTFWAGLARGERIEIPDFLKGVFSEDLFEARRYFPLEIESGGKVLVLSYFGGFDHLSVATTTFKEGLESLGFYEDISALYVKAGIESLRTLHSRIEPRNVEYRNDGVNYRLKGRRIACCSVVTVSRLATFDFEKRVKAKKVRLLSIGAYTGVGLSSKFLAALVIGGKFPHGPDALIKLRILGSRDVDEISLFPSEGGYGLDRWNACLDGELVRLEDKVGFRRSDMGVDFILPKALILHEAGG